VQFLEAGPSLVDRTMWLSLKNVCPPLYYSIETSS